MHCQYLIALSAIFAGTFQLTLGLSIPESSSTSRLSPLAFRQEASYPGCINRDAGKCTVVYIVDSKAALPVSVAAYSADCNVMYYRKEGLARNADLTFKTNSMVTSPVSTLVMTHDGDKKPGKIVVDGGKAVKWSSSEADGKKIWSAPFSCTPCFQCGDWQANFLE